MDAAQLVLYAFWLFFAGLVYYLRQEDKREGYPLQSDRGPRITMVGWPPLPTPKTFLLPHGGSVQAPRVEAFDPVGNAAPSGRWPGAPLVPLGDPMVDGVGPAAYAKRRDVPDRTVLHGVTRIVPLRVDSAHSVAPCSTDPRGMTVVGFDGEPGGKVVDLWFDRAEMIFRYLEVEVAGGKHTLLPMTLAIVDGDKGVVKAASVKGAHFAKAPVTAKPDEVTLREEDRVSAYFASGHLYATTERSEPLI